MRHWFERLLDNTVFMILVLGGVTAGLGSFLYHNWMYKQNNYFSQQEAILTTAYRASIQMYRLAMDGFYTNIICRPDITKVFSEGVHSTGRQQALARGRLYRQLYPHYMAMKDHNLLQLHFHMADGTSFLRFHQPDRYGDDLMDVRPSVRIANTEKRPVHGFEAGKVRSGFRHIYPVTWNGEHLGTVEVGVTAKAIRDAMAELTPNWEYAFLLKRQSSEPFIFKEQRWLYRASEINPGFIIEDADALLPDSPPPLSNDAVAVNRQLRDHRGLQMAMSRGHPITLGTRAGTHPLVVSLIPIQDVLDQVVGYLVAYSPDRVSAICREEFIAYLTTAGAALGVVSMLLLGLRRRTAALSREQRNRKAINDTLAEGVFVMDKHGVMLDVNPAACRMLGYAASELIGHAAHDRFHCHLSNGFLDRQACAFSRHVSRGEPYDGEELFLKKDGSIFTVQVASRPIMRQGRLAGSVTAFHDISDRKRTEEALRKSEETARKLSTAVEQSPTGVVITDLEGAIEYVNPKFEEKTGYSLSEVVGKNPRMLQAGTMPQETYVQLWASITAGREWKGELHNRRKNGELYWELAAISPIRDANGATTHYVAVKEDVTERKRMEEELREKELIQRTLMERMPVGLVIIDARTHQIEMVNPTAARMFGAPEEAIRGHRCHRFLCPAADGACPIIDLGQTIDSSDRVLVRHDGTRIPVLKTVTRIAIQGEEKLLECFIDISTRIAAEDALKQANQHLKAAITKAEALAEQAEAANRSKSIFLANMSHEIRTPLNAILGYSQLLYRDRSLSTEHRQQVLAINRSGDHLLELINDILEMSKIEAGHIKIQQEPMAFSRLIDDIRTIFQLACRKKGLSLRMEIADPMPARILADQGRVRQIIINLLSNAVKFTARGGITLRASAEPQNEKPWRMCIDVTDTGRGIDATEQGRLFQAFEQTASGQKASEGTGLGLSISRAYARAMGGDLILAHSSADQGAVFRFTFPFDACVRPEITPAQTVQKPVPTGLLPGRPAVRVMIVEDDAVSRKLLHKLLTGVGFDVQVVDSGEAALDVVASFQPHVVLMDVCLPGIDGYETARQMRRLPGGREVQIITVTASGVNTDEIRAQALASGVDGFVAKPFKVADILEKIKMLCGVSYLYDEPADTDDASAEWVPDGKRAGNLPAKLRDELKSAVEMGDMMEFDRLADQVTMFDHRLKHHLTELAHQYDYTALLALLSPSPAVAESGQG